jgi:hypothetical protein
MRRLVGLTLIGGLLFTGSVQAELSARSSSRKFTVTITVTVTGGPRSIGRTTRSAANVEVQVRRRPILANRPQVSFTGRRGRAAFHISSGLYKIEVTMGGGTQFCEVRAHERVIHNENLTLKCSLP